MLVVIITTRPTGLTRRVRNAILLSMKTFIVRIEFTGLTGKYHSDVEVKARNAKSAEKKASLVIGNRDAWIVSVTETV